MILILVNGKKMLSSVLYAGNYLGITGEKLRFIHDNYKLKRKKYLLEQLKSMIAKLWIIAKQLVGYDLFARSRWEWIKSKFYTSIGQPMMVVSEFGIYISNNRYRKWYAD